MNYPFTDNYDRTILADAMMGPNAMRIMEELTCSLSLSPGMRVLDLGCGTGISSILLAEKYGVTVFAADLWIDATENAGRFSRLGLDAKIIPLSLDATKDIPFAHGYFDAIVSVDAYQYFGDNGSMLSGLLPFLKQGGTMAVAVPGFTEDFFAEKDFLTRLKSPHDARLAFLPAFLVAGTVGAGTRHCPDRLPGNGLLQAGVGRLAAIAQPPRQRRHSHDGSRGLGAFYLCSACGSEDVRAGNFSAIHFFHSTVTRSRFRTS